MSDHTSPKKLTTIPHAASNTKTATPYSAPHRHDPGRRQPRSTQRLLARSLWLSKTEGPCRWREARSCIARQGRHQKENQAGDAPLVDRHVTSRRVRLVASQTCTRKPSCHRNDEQGDVEPDRRRIVTPQDPQTSDDGHGGCEYRCLSTVGHRRSDHELIATAATTISSIRVA